MPKKLEKKYSISDELKERTYKFAIGILELVSMLSNTEEGRVIRRQLCKSGTSISVPIYIGKEADGSLTRNDFVYRVDISFRGWNKIHCTLITLILSSYIYICCLFLIVCVLFNPLKECKESRYWLRIIIDRKLLKKELVLPHLNECVELKKNYQLLSINACNNIFRYLGIFNF